MKTKRVFFCFILIFLCLSSVLAGGSSEKSLRILATSDIHGKFYPYDYNLNKEDTSGSLAQIASAIDSFRTENTILIDCGDSIQGNMTEPFLEDGIHPVILGLNLLNYDIGVTGNHEYNFGMETLKEVVSSFSGTVLTGNVYDENSQKIADGYTIMNIDGVRVAIIGMVTPYIQFWDAENLKNCTVTDPVEETKKIIESIRGQYDVLIGAMHMGLDRDYNYPNSSVKDLAEACPEFDVILASHEHKLYECENINGVLVIENLNAAQTMAVVDLSLRRSGDIWEVKEKTSKAIDISEYESKSEVLQALSEYHEKAVAKASEPIGYFDGDYLVKSAECFAIPTCLVEDVEITDLITRVMMKYAEADVACIANFRLETDISRGPLYKADMGLIYRYINTIYKFQMTGKQLKRFLEWNAAFYQKFNEGDLTVAFSKDRIYFSYYVFSGIEYEIDISQDVGSRIKNLTWNDGRTVEDSDVFSIAVDSYSASNYFLKAGEIFEEGSLPVLLEKDVRSDLGSISDIIEHYIVHDCNGVLKVQCDNSWKITGFNWDDELHRKAVELINDRTIVVTDPGVTMGIAHKTVREEDLRAIK